MRSSNVGRILQQVGGALARDTRSGGSRGYGTQPGGTTGYRRRSTPTTTGGGLGRMVTRFLRSR